MGIEVATLRLNPLFASLANESLVKLAECAETALFGQGVGIVAGVDSGDEVYLILEGQAQVQVVLNDPGHPGDTIIFKPGDLVAVVRFFDEPFQEDAVVANTDIRALKWHAADLRSISKSDPESGYLMALGLGKLVIQRTRQISSHKSR